MTTRSAPLKDLGAASARWTRAVSLHTVMALLLTLSIPAPQAFAQDGGSEQTDIDAQLAELEARAKEAYDRGDYQEAIRQITQANQLRPHPNYLINIAFTYSEMKDCTNARIWAQNALDNKTIDDRARKAAQSIIDTCLEDGNPDQSGIVSPEAPPPAPKKSVIPYIAWPLAAVGAAGLTYLIIQDQMLLADKRDHEEKRSSVDANDGDAVNDFNSRGDKLEARELDDGFEIAAFTVTGLMLATGVGLLIYDMALGAEASPQSDGDAAQTKVGARRLRLAPMIGPETGGFMLQADF